MNLKDHDGLKMKKKIKQWFKKSQNLLKSKKNEK